MIRNINEAFGEFTGFSSVEEMENAIRECGYEVPDDGLVERRDYVVEPDGETLQYIHAHADEWTGCHWTTSHGRLGIDLDEIDADTARERAAEIGEQLRTVAAEARRAAEDDGLPERDQGDRALLAVCDELGLRCRLHVYHGEDGLPTGDYEYQIETDTVPCLLTTTDRLIEIAEADWTSAVRWLEQVESDARIALEAAHEALGALLEGEYDLARERAEKASAIEREYGDSPTWGGLVAAVERDIYLHTCPVCGERCPDSCLLESEPSWECETCRRDPVPADDAAQQGGNMNRNTNEAFGYAIENGSGQWWTGHEWGSVLNRAEYAADELPGTLPGPTNYERDELVLCNSDPAVPEDAGYVPEVIPGELWVAGSGWAASVRRVLP